MDGDDEAKTTLSIGKDGKEKIHKGQLKLALALSKLVRSSLLVQDVAAKDMSEFVCDADSKLNGIYPSMQERFLDLTRSCRACLQEALQSHTETDSLDNGQQEDVDKKLKILGASPLLLQSKAKEAGLEMLPALTALKESYDGVMEGGLDSIRDVRLKYRREDGLKLFQAVKDLDKAGQSFSVCVCVCVQMCLRGFSAIIV